MSSQNNAANVSSPKGAKKDQPSSERNPAPAQEDEYTPLLASADSANREHDDQNVEGGHPPSSKAHTIYLVRRPWSWIWKNALVIGLSLLLIIGIVVACIHRPVNRPKPVLNPPVCTTPGCVLAASELLRSISPNYKNTDPCTDFHTMVCEGFDDSHDLRDDQTDIWTGEIMRENADSVLRHVLESPGQSEIAMMVESSSADVENLDKIQDAYQACMNETEIKSHGVDPLIGILLELQDRLMGSSFKLSSDQSPPKQPSGLPSSSFSRLSDATEYLMSIGVEALISLSVQADDKEPDNQVVFLNAAYPPGLPSKAYYKDKGIVELYRETMIQVFGALKEYENSTRWTQSSVMENPVPELVEALIDFETKIAAASPDPEDAQNVEKYYNPYTLEEASAFLPQVSVPYLISSRAHGFKPEKIIVGSPSYLKAVSEFIETSEDWAVGSYYFWKAIQAFGSLIEDDALKPLAQLNNKLAGKDSDAKPERWRTCSQEVDSGLRWILSRFYIERAFSKELKEFGNRVISDIKHSFVKKLDASDWMNLDARKLGIEKVHNIAQKIGYPTKSPNIRDSNQLQEYYARVNINSSDYFGNRISMNKNKIAKGWEAAGKPTDKDVWLMSASTVNAYYDPPMNEIVFPAGIMQAPAFYDPSIPQYLSYGAFGSVSGHELSHAFDSMGRHYDKDGHFTDWWDNATVAAFEKKARCFVEQYSNFTKPNRDGSPRHVNGLLTLGENIADAGGVTASFQAWKRRDGERPDPLLPGLQHSFTKEQLFFVSYANWWCGKTRPETVVNRLLTDPHSPFDVRVVGTMANSREFRESFDCPAKEPTCELW